MRHPRWDRVATAWSVTLFSASLGVGMLAVPLLVIAAGHGLSAVGIFVSISALAQMATRIFIGSAMRRWSERALLIAAALLLCGGYMLIAFDHHPVAIAAGMVIEGVARAVYWTSGQTHMIRTSNSSGSSLALFMLVSSIGLAVGPLVGGVLSGRAPELALIGAAVIAFASVPAVFFFVERLALFEARKSSESGSLWRRSGFNVACWISASSGAWRAILTAYVPLILTEGGHAPGTIGALLSLTNVCTIAGSVFVGWVGRRRQASAVFVAVALSSVPVMVLALLAGEIWVAGAALVLTGVGGGALQTLGPAIAADKSGSDELADVIALVGIFRSGATFAAPLLIAAVVFALPLAPAMALAGVALSAPLLAHSQLRPRR